MADEWPGQRLHQYAIFDRHDAMLDILQGDERRNINAQDLCGRTPVYTAVSNNSIKCLEALLQHGADPSIAGGERVRSMTPLHQALLECKMEAIRLLLQYGADLSRIDETGMSPVELSRSIGSTEYIQIFEQEDERRSENALKVVADLCTACEDGDLSRVKDILRVPPPTGWELANIEVPDDGRIPLVIAIQRGNAEIMSELLATIMELQASPSPMLLAVEAAHPQIVRLLLKKFPNCCKVKDEQNQTPLHVACQTGCLDIVKLLMEWDYPDSLYQSVYDQHKQVQYKLAFLVNDLSADGKSALYMACENGHEEVVDFLLNFSVNGVHVGRPFETDTSSDGLLNLSSGTIHPAELKIVVKPIRIDCIVESVIYNRSTHINTPVCHTLSCMYIAVKNGHLKIVQLLADAEAEINMTLRDKDVEYSLLLKVALENKDSLMLNKLLAVGVSDVNNYVFEEAVRSYPEFISHFLKYKASEDKTNKINKKLMIGEYSMSSMSREKLEGLLSSDPSYKRMLPTESVSLRWQNLKVLSTVEPAWLTTTVNLYNPAMSNPNARIQMFAVTRVDVSNSSITMVPIALLELPSLSILVSAYNKITEFPSQTNFSLDCQVLEELYVQYNQLVTIPNYILTLPRLRVLDASNNKINRLPASLWHSVYLKSIDLSHNQIEALPRPVIATWRKESEEGPVSDGQAESLEFENNQLHSSTDSHVIFHHLKRANHWTDNIVISDEAVKAAENHKKGLKTLKLGHNLITIFPEFLSCCCPQLESLEMQKNKLKTLGNLAAYPKLLKTLDLSQNMIESMADWQMDNEIRKCFFIPRQTSLVGSGMFGASPGLAACVHRSHTKLENLDSLDLYSNCLTSLIVLRAPDLSQSSSMMQTIQDREAVEKDIQGKLLFPNICSLNLDSNKFSHLTDNIKEMKTLKTLSLKKNLQLKELPPSLGLLERLQRIEVDLCPLEGPIQDVIKGASSRVHDITGFLRSVLEESEQYNCMNLMIVGSFDIGKTSLLQQLMKKGRTNSPMRHYTQRMNGAASGCTTDGKPLSTVGIDISQLILEGKHGTVEFRTWDFAGQIEYYATHQYFLSPRSLYLVVWNLTHGEPGVEGLRQWLVNIQAQAPGAPVLIVGTHLDEIQKKKKDFPSNWEVSMVRRIQEKFMRPDNDNVGLPKVLDVLCVAASKRATNIDKLQKAIYDRVFTLHHPSRKNEKLLGHKVPKKYMKLQSVISEIVRTRKSNDKDPVLDASSYLLNVMEEMSKDDSQTNFRNKEDLNQATRFLHENGVLCHFEDLSLKDQYFLEPQWLCDQLARVVSIKEVQQYCKNGIMTLRDMYQLYNDTDKIGQYILNLLNKFEVALQFDTEHLLLPSLLPTDTNLLPESMREIPVRRNGLIMSSNASVSSIDLLFNPSSIPVSGDNLMHIACTMSQNNPAFSNTRLYLLTYFPSGFWPRLLTRVLGDERFYEPVVKMYQFPQEIVEKCPDIQKETPKWRCWQTGFELVYFGNVVMQVKEVRNNSYYARGMCNYREDGLGIECHFDSQWGELDVEDSVILEISFQADKITFNFGHQDVMCSGGSNFRSIEPRDIYHDEKAKTAVLARIVEHIDCLLQDWFPEIGESRFIQSCQGRYLVTRVVPCPLCLHAEIQHQNTAQGAWEMYSGSLGESHQVSISQFPTGCNQQTGVRDVAKRVMCTFLVEKCIKNVLEGLDEICKIHGSVSPSFMPTEDGVTRLIHIAPDAVFQDLDESFVVEDDVLLVTEKLGQGAFGTVSKAKLKRNEHSVFDVAVKMLYDPKSKVKRKINHTTQICLETVCAAYTTARQEVSILQTVEHPHIVPLLGLSRRPLALLLSLAPLGSLNNIFENRHKDGLRLPVWVIKQVVIQVADALDYLHGRHIIYRDLKSGNILAWNIPGPNDLDPRQPVLVKLADYGISKSVLPGGTKGFGGTPPFIAPEILMHTGRDTYTEKVDIFSFGMFMFELLTCRQPLGEINNINVHVVHGGRPTLTNDEAVYPSHMLDLMNICWDHDPENRPSAAHLRLIASSPQFCHLSDAVTTETESTMLSACSVFVENLRLPDATTGEEHSQVWMVSHGDGTIQLEIMSYNMSNMCTTYRELKQDHMMMAVCNVEEHVWCLDQNGILHIYCPATIERQGEYSLPVATIEIVHSMSYHRDSGGYVVILLKEQQKRTPVIFCFTVDGMKSGGMVQMVSVDGDCFCASVVSSGESYKLWYGGNDSAVFVMPTDHLDGEATRINACEAPSSKQQNCRFIATPVNMANSHCAWTYNYPGSKVFRWDTDEQKVTGMLDCSNKIPATDSYYVQKARKFEANHYQVTALSAVGQYLYVGTTWGCVIVADAIAMHPYSVFRCHGDEEFYCKAILHLGPVVSVNQLNKQAQMGEHKLTDTLHRRNTRQGTMPISNGSDKTQGIVTIGRGYRDIINLVTTLEKQALVRHDMEDGWAVVDTGSAPVQDVDISRQSKFHTFVLSWEPEHWEFY